MSYTTRDSLYELFNVNMNEFFTKNRARLIPEGAFGTSDLSKTVSLSWVCVILSMAVPRFEVHIWVEIRDFVKAELQDNLTAV